MIKAIIFDYFGVICSDEYWNFVKSDKNIESNFKQLANAVNLGEVKWREFIATIADKTGQTEERVAELYNSARINPKLVAYIVNLHKEYQTALLTSASHEFLEPIIEKMHFKKVFDEIVISSRVGLIKPDPKIFHYTLEKLGIKPAEAVFVDDIASNAQAASLLGIKAICYQDFSQFKAELERILSQS